MSPQLILILMFSVSTLLIVLLFALRRRQKASTPPALETSSAKTESESTTIEFATAQMPGIDLGEEDSQLKFTAEDLLKDFSFVELPVAKRSEDAPADHHEMIELMARYQFFQGKNLEQFTKFVQDNNRSGVELLIKEKFEAQGKPEAGDLARKITERLYEQF